MNLPFKDGLIPVIIGTTKLGIHKQLTEHLQLYYEDNGNLKNCNSYLVFLNCYNASKELQPIKPVKYIAQFDNMNNYYNVYIYDMQINILNLWN